MRKPINVDSDGCALTLRACYFKSAGYKTILSECYPCTGVIECDDSWPFDSDKPDGRQGDKRGGACPDGDGGDTRFRDGDGL